LTVRFSIRLNNDLPLGEYAHLARVAESAGFHQFWVSNDLFFRSVWVILSHVAAATSRIQLGTCIVNPYTMHPAEIAMAAASLDELSHGRFCLGLSSGASDFLQWVGIAADRPLTRVLETVQVLRKLFAGESAELDGREMSWRPEAYLRFRARPIPIYLGAMSPGMLRAIGRVADGGLPLLFPPEHYATAMRHITGGMAEAGRTRDEVDVAACVWCSVGTDAASAEAVLRDKIAYYGHALSPLILDALQVDRAEFEPIQAAIQVDRDAARARAMVTPRMLSIGIAGSPKDLVPRLESLVSAGARHLSFGPPLGPDPAEAIGLLGRDVLPYFR
jgi:5,10-methylenetetrahydromethanopterin reductase